MRVAGAPLGAPSTPGPLTAGAALPPAGPMGAPPMGVPPFQASSAAPSPEQFAMRPPPVQPLSMAAPAGTAGTAGTAAPMGPNPMGSGPMSPMAQDQATAMLGAPVPESGPAEGEPGMRQETLATTGSRMARRKPGAVQRLGMAKVAAIGAAAAVIVGGGGIALAMSASGDDGSGTVKPQVVADAARVQPVADPAALEAQRRDEALARAKRAARRDKRKAPVLVMKGTPLPTKTPTAEAPPAGNPVPKGEAQRIAKELMPGFGFDPDTQFGCLVNLWDRESGWRTTAGNPSGAYGIPQALPGSKMASAGPNWQTNATTQIKWGLGYIKGRYKNPCGAWSAFQSKGWY